MTDEITIQSIIAEAEMESERYSWEGTFEQYLRLVVNSPSKNRLSHAYIYEAIMSSGSNVTREGDRTYNLFQDDIFGLLEPLDRIVEYFASSAQRFEVRKRILLLIGPPASGKSTVVELIKRAMEVFSKTDKGTVYAIKGCPMQEEPLHLIPENLRPQLYDQYGIYVEGDLCPRCRYLVRSEYKGRYADVPVERVTFSEQEAIGIGCFMANNPNPSDSSLLVGSVNTERLEGDRFEVAGKAFRLDGEFNVANRGMVELVEMFKADKHLINSLLSLAQEQYIKMEKFGSVYADEVIVGHSNRGDFDEFSGDKGSEALRDRIIAVQIPYNLRVSEEVKIYRKMLEMSQMEAVHLAPLTLRVASAFSILSRMVPSDRHGISMLDKMNLYDGQANPNFTRQDVRDMQHRHPMEGMTGISPRYVMNRLSAVASQPNVRCVTPLSAIGSLWDGLEENVSYNSDVASKVAHLKDAVQAYNDMAVRQVQIASEEAFEAKANDLLAGYLTDTSAYLEDISKGQYRPTSADAERERDMRELERVLGIADRSKDQFRREIQERVADWQSRDWAFEYDSDPRLKEAIEKQILITPNELKKNLVRPRFARQRVEWERRWSSITSRLVDSYGYCNICANDLVEYVDHILDGRPAIKLLRNGSLLWIWERYPQNGNLASEAA